MTNHAVPSLSVVVPLAPGERAWAALAADLAALPPGSEVLLASPTPPAGPSRPLPCAPHRWSWVRTPKGRAVQMNAAARAARGRFLWFLHADTRLPDGAIAALLAALAEAPHALHYFDLGFLDDGPPLMRLTAGAVRLRSRWLGLPFGDQGFCLARDLFWRAGGYDERARYGEDHLLVWQAARVDVPLRPVGASILTSARKYRAQGWTRTTLRHALLTYKQAIPEWLRSRTIHS